MTFCISAWEEAATQGVAPSAEGFAESLASALTDIEEVMLGGDN